MTVDLSMPGELPEAVTVADAVEARALALLDSYLRRAPFRTEAEDMIARDAWLQGWRSGYFCGGRDSLESCSALATGLNDRRFATALATLVQFLNTPIDPARPDWRTPRTV